MNKIWDFPGGPVVRTLHCRDMGLIPGWGTKTPYAAPHNPQNKQTKINK